MPENNIQKPKEEQLEFAEETIPAELIDFISSENMSAQIADICLKNGVEDERQITEISYRIAFVVLGRLPKEDLAMVIKNGSGLSAEISEKISAEVDEAIFSKMPQTQSQPSPKVEISAGELTTPSEEKIEKTSPEQLKPETKDTYREALE